MHDHYWSGSSWDGWMIIYGVFWLFLLALLILGVVLVVRSSRSAEGSAALNLLNERYARGEIERDEYLQRKKDILER